MMKKEPNYKHYTRGGQIAFHNLRMWDQITKTLGFLCVLIWLIVVLSLLWFLVPKDMTTHALDYQYARFLEAVGQSQWFTIPYHGHVLKQSVAALVNNPFYAHQFNRFMVILTKTTLIASGFSCLAGLGLIYYFVRKGRQQTNTQFIRGASIVPAQVLKKQIKDLHLHSDLNLDGFPLIRDSEVQHLLVHGTVGMGKSQLIMKLMDCLKKRGDRVIVYDKGCTFTERFFDEQQDVLLNPFDVRCAHWDLWLEAPEDAQLDNMVASLIPMQGESDPFWVDAARTVVSSVASRMRQDPERSIAKLLNVLVSGDFEQLETYLKGTAAATLVSNKIEKTAISIRSVITTYLKSLQSLNGLEALAKPPFSIRDYLLNPQESGWLFISSNGEQHKVLKPLISMWIAMASLTLLSLPEDSNRRIWFICDELPSLHKLPLLGETIAEVRKFGGCFLLGMQSFSQLVKVYGRSGATEIFDLLNTRAFFASPSYEMAQLVSKELGEEEVDEARENYSYGANSVRDGISVSKNRLTRPIVSYPEIMALAPLTCFLRVPGAFPLTELTLRYQNRPQKAAGFIKRKLLEINKEKDEFKSSSNGRTGEEHSFPLKKQSHFSKKKNTIESKSLFD